MKLRHWLYLTLLITLVRPPESAGAASSGRIFQHPQGFFTVEVPEGWTVEAGGLVFRFRKGNFLAKLVVQEVPDHLEMAKAWTGRELAELRNVRAMPGINMPWGGVEGGRQNLYGGVAASGEMMKIEVLSTSDGRRSYIMILSGPLPLWDDLGKEWRSFVYDFTVCAAPGSNCPAPSARVAGSAPPPATAPATMPSGMAATPGSVFRDPKQRFNVQVPGGWNASATGEGAVLSRGSAYANVLVMDGPQPGRNIVDMLTGQVGKQWRNFQEVQGGESALGGLRADFSMCTGTNPKGVPAVLRVVSAADQRYTYTMIISAPQAELEAVQNDLIQIEQTFSPGARLTQPSAADPPRQVIEQARPAPAAPVQTPGQAAPPARPSSRQTAGQVTQAAPVAVQAPALPSAPARPSPPDVSLKPFQGSGFSISIPANWKRFQAPSDLLYSFSTDDGVRRQQGWTAIALGMIAGYAAGGGDLRAATDGLIRKVLAENSGTRLSASPRQQIQVGGLPAESLLVEGESPLPGEQQIIWLVAVLRPKGLFHIMLVCPRSDFSNLRVPFGRIVSSVRFD